MKRIFVDSSVLYSAAISATGASREIIRLGIVRQVTLVLSQYVIGEIRENLIEKTPAKLPIFEHLAQLSVWEFVEPTPVQILKAARVVTDVDDAPIVAAAKKAKVDALVTFNDKHLITQPVAEYIGALVGRPGEVLRWIREG